MYYIKHTLQKLKYAYFVTTYAYFVTTVTVVTK